MPSDLAKKKATEKKEAAKTQQRPRKGHEEMLSQKHSLSLTLHGQQLFSDTKLELNSGRGYGLIGLNGIGKSMLLSAIGKCEVPIAEHIDIYRLTREMPPSDKTTLQRVMEGDTERAMLEKEAERLAHEDTESQETKRLQWRLEERVALAKALFVRPFMRLLDEPTNNLDLDACVWLEEELKTFKHNLVLVSHSQDFLNGIHTNIIHMHNKTLKYYTGNYDQYLKTRLELEENHMKRFR
uniref:ABC transporter domain-containing protein n=1 Tax=Pipistrellus kuhlii TaxID=59472 RepID=A0A7J7ZJN9_PIPKU|nr:hypothetical protein mPipKuh1_009395 [Pipistrellus kuhlii]